MKKLILTLILFLITISSYSQVRILYSEKYIREDFGDRLTTNFTENGVKFLRLKQETYSIAYYINNNGICYLCMITPYNPETLKSLKEFYNQNYVKLSDTEWKEYKQNGVIFVTQTEVENKPVFLFFANTKNEYDDINNQY